MHQEVKNENLKLYEAIKVDYIEDLHEFKVTFGIAENKNYRDTFTFLANEIKSIKIDDELFMFYCSKTKAEDYKKN